MNLNDNPTLQKLSDLHKLYDDTTAHHIVWVDSTGEVHITPRPDGMSPSDFNNRFPTCVFRYETCQLGNGYVGPAAAADMQYMQRLLNSLIEEWKVQDGSTVARYIDYF